MGRTANFIGPLVSSAIVDASGSTSTAFYFPFAVAVVATAWLIFGVDPAKSQREQARFLKAEGLARAKLSAMGASTHEVYVGPARK